jgi:NDP-sugar pyrophosphorylase family protein
MQAVILVGGLGTRLQPVLHDLPKPMAPVQGSPFLEYQLTRLKRSGVDEIILCAGYRADMVRAYFGDGARWGLHLHYSIEPSPLGTAGALKYAEALLGDSFLVLNGDTYLELDYLALQRAHWNKRALATIVLVTDARAQAYGNVMMGDDGRIGAFDEKPTNPSNVDLINAGAYFCERGILNSIPRGRAVSLEKETFPDLLAYGAAIYGFQVSGYFIDMGTPEKYRQFEQDVQKGYIHVDPQKSSTPTFLCRWWNRRAALPGRIWRSCPERNNQQVRLWHADLGTRPRPHSQIA